MSLQSLQGKNSHRGWLEMEGKHCLTLSTTSVSLVMMSMLYK